uniref:Uncharacterized protein n=1 Tax=Haemonchus contortus TaxID=6289 RepID=A0A7I4YI76_HAECO
MTDYDPMDIATKANEHNHQLAMESGTGVDSPLQPRGHTLADTVVSFSAEQDTDSMDVESLLRTPESRSGAHDQDDSRRSLLLADSPLNVGDRSPTPSMMNTTEHTCLTPPLDTATSSQASKSTAVAPVHRPCSPPRWVAALASKSLRLQRLRYFNVATALQPPSRGVSSWARGTRGARSASQFAPRSSSTRPRRGRPSVSTGLSRQDAALSRKDEWRDWKSDLPERTPEGYTHHLAQHHPWAPLVRPRPSRYADIKSEWVTSELPVDQYRPIPPSGYHATRWVRSLFPVFIRDLPSTSNKIPVMELQTLEAAIHFREESAAIIRSTLDGHYQEPVRQNQQTPLKSYSSTLAPPRSGGFQPVLYQVVAVGYGNGVILEAKDFFVVGPDRRDLHCIVLELTPLM